jgi:hypothetical protein
MDVEFVHKPRHDNVVPNALNKKEEFQVERPLTKTHPLRVIIQGENNLERKIKEAHM